MSSTAISKFLGEAAEGGSSDAVVRVEITGSPPAVQKAVRRLAASKSLGAGGRKNTPDLSAAADDLKDTAPKGPKGPKLPVGGKPEGAKKDTEELAVDVVEKLIQEPLPAVQG